MNTIGFPNTDIYMEHEHGGEESFWPSFTDIMMVIVMTFLLITVAVILNNWELVNSLKASVAAEQQAAAQAQSALQVVETKSRENETLEERLLRIEQLLASRNKALQESQLKASQTLAALTASQADLTKAQGNIDQLSTEKTKLVGEKTALEASKASLEAAKTKLVETLKASESNTQLQEQKIATLVREKEQVLLAADDEKKELETQLKESSSKLESLAEVQDKVQEMQRELDAREQEISSLKARDTEGHDKLLSLQGEYDELDKKYQKLLRPARSDKNKHVVRVIYDKVAGRGAYQIVDMGRPAQKISSRAELGQKLSVLKQEYGNDLYVKIIIPESSSISHTEAWKFTSEILNEYDYYYSDEKL